MLSFSLRINNELCAFLLSGAAYMLNGVNGTDLPDLHAGEGFSLYCVMWGIM